PYNTQTICRTDWVMVKSTENRKFELNRSQQLSHTRFGVAPNRDTPTELLDDHRALEPPDPIPNSAVKRRFADGSVGFPHVRVGHRQAPKTRTPIRERGLGFCLFRPIKSASGSCPWLFSSQRLDAVLNFPGFHQLEELITQPLAFRHGLAPIACAALVVAQIAFEVGSIRELAVGQVIQISC